MTLRRIRFDKRLIASLVAITLLLGSAQLFSRTAAVAAPGADTPPLFADSATPGSLDTAGDATTVRTRYVRVNLGLLDGQKPGDAVTLNLFPDVAFPAVLDRVEPGRAGGYTWIGHLAGVAHGQAILVVRDGLVAGNVALPGAFYQVRYAGNGVHAIHEIDQRAFPSEADPVPAATPAGTPAPADTQADDGSTIDVLVVYTGAARAGAGGTSAMEALIDLAVSESNQGYANSDVVQRLNLVHTQEVTYDETGFDWSQTLSRLRNKTDGYMDDVHTLRDAYCADEVVLIVNNTAYCGIAYLMTTLSHSFESSAFAVVSRVCATGYYSFAHELGHNMGSHHDRANASGPGVYSYSYGYWALEYAFRTIMAYNCPGGCTRINHWSNPDVTYGGQPTGVIYTAPDSADNHRSLNNTAYTVANWRTSCASNNPPNTPSDPTPANGATGQSADVDLGWTGGDPDAGDTVTYDVYLEADDATPDVLVCDDATTPTCDPGTLDYDTHYTWYVVATDNHGASATGPTWDFTTGSPPPTYTIEGTVRDLSGAGIDGVAVSFGGVQPAVTTDGSGYYAQTGFADGSYTVAFSRAQYAFSPMEDLVTVSGANAVHDVIGTLFAPVSLPFSDGFEGGDLGAGWAVETDYEGRVQVSGSYPYTGSYGLLLDDDAGNDTYSHAAAILALDLSGHSQVDLSFWWHEFSDEDDSADGVFISDDYGATWYQVFSFAGDTPSFSQVAIDLDAQAGAAGMSLNDHFLVKFQFYDNYGIASDGYAIDDVLVEVPIPATPTDLVAAPVSESRINLSWTDNSTGESGFEVERSPDGTSDWVQIATVEANVTSYPDTGLTTDTPYYYRVRAHGESGDSGYSNVADARTLPYFLYLPLVLRQ